MNKEFLAAGAQIAVVVVDAPRFNAVMAAKLELPFPVVSDPGGEKAIKPLGLWNEQEGNTRTSIVVLAPEGSELFRHEGVDDEDHPAEADVLNAVRAARLPARRNEAR